jgi:hypothetical protein
MRVHLCCLQDEVAEVLPELRVLVVLGRFYGGRVAVVGSTEESESLITSHVTRHTSHVTRHKSP